ncbi:putative ABC transport system permease protein [Arcanobacterium pluranimalium]|uniref:ABC transporter permease n=1 Tax=Arcanobacterium pluranimalium TaxID=108028 RepID=UPI00195BF037|nr:ABC transporter permease [Arcanobacterium pluranimalium]MBM7824631.1 putative ABC transport system permease protein [Arcanobacterium pluranimalium]
MNVFVATGLGLILMLGLIVFLQLSAGVRAGFAPVWAVVRAIVQLAAIAAVLHGIFQKPATAAIFLAVMVAIAVFTASKRLQGLPFGTRAASVSIVIAAVVCVAIIFSCQMMEPTVSNLIAVGGIIIGNSMSAATLAGRNFLRTSRAQRGEIEGWFALGARPKQAFAEVSRTSIHEMLIPNLDQTKNTGLVTLPGAFVGALVGGASPIQAARFQVVVLVGIMLAQTIVGVVSTRILSRATVIVADAESTK